jgi:branched-chain amino acid aminotransferase
VVRGEEVWTSTGDYCLPGITRAKTIEVCREAGIPVRERNFSLSETHSADEAFLTGTFGGQVPVGSIDGRTLGEGGEGPLTRRIRALYEALVERETGG